MLPNVTVYCSGKALTATDYADVICSVSFALLAIIGNAIILLAMNRESMFKFGGYLTLAHFSLCDFLNAFVALFYYPIGVLSKCHWVWVTPVIMFAETSRKVFNAYMPISRFLVIMFPVRCGVYFDLSHTKKWLGIDWVLCFSLTFPMAYPSMGIVLNTEINQWAGNKDGPAYFPVYSLICNVVPTVLMVVLYPSCFYKLVKQSRTVNSNQNSSNNSAVSKRDRQILYTFSANAVIFTLYWLPFYISMLSGGPYVPHLMETMRGIQSAYNPFVYCILNPSIRKAVKSLFCGETVGGLSQVSSQKARSRGQAQRSLPQTRKNTPSVPAEVN